MPLLLAWSALSKTAHCPSSFWVGCYLPLLNFPFLEGSPLSFGNSKHSPLLSNIILFKINGILKVLKAALFYFTIERVMLTTWRIFGFVVFVPRTWSMQNPPAHHTGQGTAVL